MVRGTSKTRHARLALGCTLVFFAGCTTSPGAREHMLGPVAGDPAGHLRPLPANDPALVALPVAPVLAEAEAPCDVPPATYTASISDPCGVPPAGGVLPVAARPEAPAYTAVPETHQVATRRAPGWDRSDPGVSIRGRARVAHAKRLGWYVGGGGSFLPNIGVSAHAGYVFRQRANSYMALEAEGIWQFIDDETFVDDGNPAAGDWTQVRVGLKWADAMGPHTRKVLRAGATYAKAEGVPNIVQSPGDYFGAYIGAGFETDLNRNWTIGPELSLALVSDSGFSDIDHGLVPQFNWRLSYWMGGNPSCGCANYPVGDVYGGVTALLGPAVGGGLTFGQVFQRTPNTTWSFEVMGAYQDLSDGTLLAEGDGRWGQLQGGLKALFQPRASAHWTGRLGGTWIRNTAEVSGLSGTNDRVGLHAGIGYAWDLGGRFRTGPELLAHVVTPEGSFDPEVVPQLAWHFLLLL